MRNEEGQIELRSEDFHEVLQNIPPWILRWGITVLAIIIVILLVGSAVFKYPDTVTATISLTADTPPAVIVAKASGKLRELYVIDNQIVTEKECLAVIDNSARTEDVLFLKKYLSDFELNDGKINPLPPENLMLGGLQQLFTLFYMSLHEYNLYTRMDYYPAKMEILKERLVRYEAQHKNLQRQQGIMEEQLAIAKKQFERDVALNGKEVISHEELESTENRYLQASLSYENTRSSLENLRIQISQVKESLFDISFQDEDKKNAMQTQIRTAIDQLANEIRSWEMNYMLVAPIEGEITFTNYWVVNQNITGGDMVFTIVPTNDVKLIGKASLPITRSGKVRIGQRVNIRFENFPDQEYGVVEGIVKNISMVPVNVNEFLNYTVEIELPNGLMTTYKKELPYLPEMRGQADIITDDITLLERFIMPIKKILSEGL